MSSNRACCCSAPLVVERPFLPKLLPVGARPTLSPSRAQSCSINLSGKAKLPCGVFASIMHKNSLESTYILHQVFERARTSAPCVIFFDELDALCPRFVLNLLNDLYDILIFVWSLECFGKVFSHALLFQTWRHQFLTCDRTFSKPAVNGNLLSISIWVYHWHKIIRNWMVLTPRTAAKFVLHHDNSFLRYRLLGIILLSCYHLWFFIRYLWLPPQIVRTLLTLPCSVLDDWTS